MKKSTLIFLALGISFILFPLFSDSLGVGQDKNIFGAAQILSVEIGIVFILIGVGLQTIPPLTPPVLGRLGGGVEVLGKVLETPILFLLIATFLLLYILFFISPLFLTEIHIQYFQKYIPNAWTPYIGFDVEMTVSHINAWLSEGVSPYADGIVPYTPFALALFTPFIILGYPAYYSVLTLITVFSYVVSVFWLPLYFLRKKEYGILALLGVVGLFSYGFQFELERGQFNVIAFFFILLAIYIFHYQYKYRYFAYLFFIIAVQLKLYPIIFIVMLVRDWRDIKNNLKRFLALIALNFSLLFVLGYQLFSNFMEQIFKRANMQSSRYEDLSISGFGYFLSEETQIIATKYAGLIEKIFLFLFLGVIFAIIYHLYKKNQKGFNPYLFLLSTIGALIIPAASFDYKLTILVVPMMLFLYNLPRPTSTKSKMIYTLFIITLSLAYWSTLYPYEFNQVKPIYLSRNSTALLTIFFSSTFLYFFLQGKFDNIKNSQE